VRWLVLGDVCLDVVSLDSVPIHLDVREEDDMTLVSDLELRLGGSATTFGTAMSSGVGASDNACVIPAVLPDTFVGDIVEQLLWASFKHSAVTRRSGETIPVVFQAHLSQSSRLMVRPPRSGGESLCISDVQRAIESSGVEIDGVFVSGYTLTSPGSARFEAVGWTLNWAQERGVVSVVDLVPHDFQGVVGSINRVASLLSLEALCTVLVAELKTAYGLAGITPTWDPFIGSEHLQAAVAHLLAHAEACVIQFRSDANNYRQATCRAGQTILSQDYPLFDGKVPSGFGDQILVGALRLLLTDTS
jgi:hypothetical protein